MQRLHDDVTSELLDAYEIGDCRPTLCPRYPTADTPVKRHEFIYQCLDDGVKVIVGPVRRTDGWVWRVEATSSGHPTAAPELFPSFSTAFAHASEYVNG